MNDQHRLPINEMLAVKQSKANKHPLGTHTPAGIDSSSLFVRYDYIDGSRVHCAYAGQMACCFSFVIEPL